MICVSLYGKFTFFISFTFESVAIYYLDIKQFGVLQAFVFMEIVKSHLLKMKFSIFLLYLFNAIAFKFPI